MKHLLAVLLVILLSVHGLRAEKQLTDTLREVVVTGTRSEADLLQLISEQPQRLKGAVVADKIIGKAAAALMATGGVIEVHTNIIYTPARDLLEKEGIAVYAIEEVPQILNRDKSSMCPIDTQLEGIETIEECVQILQNMPPVL